MEAHPVPLTDFRDINAPANSKYAGFQRIIGEITYKPDCQNDISREKQVQWNPRNYKPSLVAPAVIRSGMQIINNDAIMTADVAAELEILLKISARPERFSGIC